MRVHSATTRRANHTRPGKHTLLRHVTQLGVLLLSLFALLVLPARAQAQAPVREDAFVYALTVYDGRIYQSAFAPPSADGIFLLENIDNVISPRMTRTYFWPLSNRYEADWLARNEFIAGTLEVYQSGTLMITLAPVSYVVQVDDADPNATGVLYTGDEATAAYAAFQAGQVAYREALFIYARDYQQYRDDVNAILASVGAGAAPIAEEDFPQRPEPVHPFTLFSTDLAQGYVINLPAGKYDIKMRLGDGSVLPGSERPLEVFAPLREGVSYTVMPRERWTQPDISRTANGAIYTPEDGAVYLQPFHQIQFNEYAYAHLLDPQDEFARRDHLRWVSFRPISGASLEVQTGSTTERYTASDYKVIQLAGSGLGYEVRELDPAGGETPSFTGFALSLPSAQSIRNVRLLDAEGAPLPGSERTLRTLHTTREWAPYALSLLPLAIGAIAIALRRRQAKRIRILDENERTPLEPTFAGS